MKALVLDTSAFIQGYDSSDPETRMHTTPAVVSEIRDEMAKIRLDNWVQSGKITVSHPDPSFEKKVLDSSKKLGESETLSSTDHSVLALALQLSKTAQTTVISDDYSVQNLCDELKISFLGLRTRGIKKRFQWIHYCPGCYKEYDGLKKDKNCVICGTELKRKPGKQFKRRA